MLAAGFPQRSPVFPQCLSFRILDISSCVVVVHTDRKFSGSYGAGQVILKYVPEQGVEHFGGC